MSKPVIINVQGMRHSDVILYRLAFYKNLKGTGAFWLEFKQKSNTKNAVMKRARYWQKKFVNAIIVVEETG